MVTIVFLQPHARALGVPLAGMGVLLVAWQLIRMLGAAVAPWLVARWGETWLLRLVPVWVVLGTVSLGLWHSLWGLALFGLVGFASAVATPVIETRSVRQTPGSIHATMMSVESLVCRGIIAVTEPGLGWLGDQYGLAVTFLVLGSGVGVSMLAVLLRWGQRESGLRCRCP